jgi:hypothetical protein
MTTSILQTFFGKGCRLYSKTGGKQGVHYNFGRTYQNLGCIYEAINEY